MMCIQERTGTSPVWKKERKALGESLYMVFLNCLGLQFSAYIIVNHNVAVMII